MKSILTLLSVWIAFAAGCQPTEVTPPVIKSPVMPTESAADSASVWVAVDDPGEIRSPQELFQFAAQRVVPNLKKLPGTKEVQILGSDRHLAVVDDLPSVIIKVSLKPGESSNDSFHQAFKRMESLPVAVNVVLEGTKDGILTIELRLPDGATAAGSQTLDRAIDLVDKLANVDNTVTYFDSAESNVAMMLVKQTSARPTVEEVTKALGELSGIQYVVNGK